MNDTTPQLQILDTSTGDTSARLALGAVQSESFPVHTLRELQAYKAGADAAQSFKSSEKPNARLLEALESTTNYYAELVNSGDAGNWDPETEEHVIEARAAIKQATTTPTD